MTLVFKFARASYVFEYLASGKYFGKVAVAIDERLMTKA